MDTWQSYAAWIEQNGAIMAEVDCETEADATREIRHYASVYGQDGPVVIKGPMLVTFQMADDADIPVAIYPPEFVDRFKI